MPRQPRAIFRLTGGFVCQSTSGTRLDIIRDTSYRPNDTYKRAQKTISGINLVLAQAKKRFAARRWGLFFLHQRYHAGLTGKFPQVSRSGLFFIQNSKEHEKREKRDEEFGTKGKDDRWESNERQVWS